MISCDRFPPTQRCRSHMLFDGTSVWTFFLAFLVRTPGAAVTSQFSSPGMNLTSSEFKKPSPTVFAAFEAVSSNSRRSALASSARRWHNLVGNIFG